MARYTRGVIAGLTFLATAFSALETLAQTPPSQSGVDFWNQVGAVSGLGKQNALGRGDYKSALDFQKSQSGSAFISTIFQDLSNDERKRIEKENQEKFEQLMRNQERLLENRITTETQTPQQETRITSQIVPEYKSTDEVLNKYTIAYSALTKVTDNDQNPKLLLEVSAKLKALLKQDREYMTTKLNSPDTSQSSRKLIEIHERLCSFYERSAQAHQDLGEVLLQREKNPELWLVVDARKYLEEGYRIAKRIEETDIPHNTKSYEEYKNRTAIRQSNAKIRIYIHQIEGQIAEVQKYLNKSGPVENFSEFAKLNYKFYITLTKVVSSRREAIDSREISLLGLESLFDEKPEQKPGFFRRNFGCLF